MAARVTYIAVGKKVFEWAYQQFEDERSAIGATVTVVSMGAIITTRLCGYAVDFNDTTVLAIGLIIGIPISLIGFAVAVSLTNKILQLIP